MTDHSRRYAKRSDRMMRRVFHLRRSSWSSNWDRSIRTCHQRCDFSIQEEFLNSHIISSLKKCPNDLVILLELLLCSIYYNTVPTSYWSTSIPLR
ncbi:hypothetical protein OSTOST_18964 [Ostertagia ostertagi]